MSDRRRLIFILGGARSGKSTYAESLAREHGGSVLYVATAEAFDDEMRERIANHRADRPAAWDTLEVPVGVGLALMARDAVDCVLIDCVTLLASNVLLKLPEDCTQSDANAAILGEIDALLGAYEQKGGVWIIVSNEVGMGLVPPYRLGRVYRDALGAANQRLALAADEVILLVAGLPWHLKGNN